MLFIPSTPRPALHQFKRSVATRAALVILALCACVQTSRAADPWQAKLDSEVRFYQTTDVGVLVVGTDKSLYGLDPETGEILWRRKGARLDENEVAAVPGTDLLLISIERGDKTRLEAADLLTGDALWRSDKVRGAVMQTAFDPDTNLLAAVLVRGAHGKAGDGLKKKPVAHAFDITTGDELWSASLRARLR